MRQNIPLVESKDAGGEERGEFSTNWRIRFR
jgi:hypothetical protein